MTKGLRLPLPENAPKAGELYKHYKGDSYQVVDIALHSNDDVWMVVYKPLYENAVADLFIRPLSEWREKVLGEYREVDRFTLIG